MEQFCMQKVRAMLSLSFLLLMLCLGVNGAWGATVTYHIINLGRLDNNGQLTSTRTEALKFTVTGDNVTVGIPDKYKSPLAKNWQYYSSDDVTYNATTKECTVNAATPSLTDESVLTTDADVYVTYDFDEAALTTVGLADGGIYNIKLADNKYLYQNTWQGDPNTATETTNDPTAAKYLWKLNIIDPYQITIQSKSSSYTDYFLTAKVGAYADIRLRNTLSTAKENKVWAFALIPGGTANTYRLIIADGYTYAAGVDCDEFKHGYLNNYDNGKSRYHLYYKNNTYQKCDLTFQALTKTFTYKIIDKQGRIAIQSSPQTQPVGKLSGYENIPEEVRSPYIVDEEVSFYTFSGDYSSDKLSDENLITELPLTDATIYVTYTTDHLSEKALKLRGARAFNIAANGGDIHDGESGNANSPNYMWFFTGGDPYAVIVKNAETSNFLAFTTPLTTPPTLSIDNAPYKFILMSGSSSDDEQQIILMPASGGTDYTSIEVTASPVSVSSNYYLIDKAGKLIVGPLPSTSQELALPTEWVSPLVSEYHYFKTSGYDDGTDTYSPTNEIYNPVEVGTDGDIYVTYDVGTNVDITGGKTYLLKFLHGQSFQQEDGKDGLMKDKDTNEPIVQKAVYPYNNGDFNLYVYGQEQWESQLANGASTRTRWLWKIVSCQNGNLLTGDDVDPYHVIIKSNQNQSLKIGDDSYAGSTYLRTYKPNDGVGFVTGVTYENTTYPNSKPDLSVQPPTEYMVIGTSLDDMILKTFNKIDGDQRVVVNSFEQYWKNNPTARDILNAANKGVGEQPVTYDLSSDQKALLTAKGWHTYECWANAAPWNDASTGGKTLANGNHWFQTINMGDGKFTIEAVDLVPQVILLDQHGWEIMRTPMYTDNNFTVVNTEGLSKFNSPMVKADGYHWYPKASKATGYHKYTISDPEPTIDVYMNGANPNNNNTVEWYCYKSVPYTSSSLAETPESNLDGYAGQDKKYKTDFYVTYEVKPVYANSYKGAATADETSASAFILEQDGKYAKIASSTSTSITLETSKPAITEDTPDDMLWNLKPNFNIDREMGYKYLGETGAQGDAKSKAATEADYMENGQNGFDPYNVQIQSKAYPQRYFTANTSGSALDGGVWKGSSSSVTLQNMTTTSRQTAAGYDQTTLNITNATFMVVDDGSGNMRLMPRFDHQKVMTSFTSLAEPSASVDVTQTFDVETIAKAKLIYSSDEIDKDDMAASYILAPGFTFTSSFTSLGTSTDPFTGTIDGQLNAISGLGVPLVAYARDATIKNVILENVDISSGNTEGDAGAICCKAYGSTRIYNCGILPTTTNRDEDGNVIDFSGSSVSGSNNVGSLVGLLGDNARVINCYSYATITGGSGSGCTAGIVGNIGYAANTSITQDDVDSKPMVVNCMFYGNISSGSNIAPVYGGASGAMIKNDAAKGVNPYCYFRGEASFNTTTNFPEIGYYKRSWSALDEYLTRFEYYRSILNSNRKLCTWWVSGTEGTAPTDDDVKNVGIAKWVLDPELAPYPVLKKWAKYPSVINPDPDQTWNTKTQQWVSRSSANDYEGKNLGTLKVNINAGGYHQGSKPSTISNMEFIITDMDTLNCDYGYYKIQLPYYNELFGDPSVADDTEAHHQQRYGGNYTDYVVTGWKITEIEDADGFVGTRNSLDNSSTRAWESGYNFADRNCTDKDLFSKSGRVFAQGGYFYVAESVKSISIEAYWGKAFYLRNAGHYIDRVNVTAGTTSTATAADDGKNVGSPFTPAGKLPDTFWGHTVHTNWQTAIKALDEATLSSEKLDKTVYDQALVLVGNLQVQNRSKWVGTDVDSKWHPHTMMSVDLDMDNEPDYCFQLQFRQQYERKGIQPIRFDFLSIPELGLAIRHNEYAYAIGIFVPQGHFEITETACMHTTQFEYDAGTGSGTYDCGTKIPAPIILNGGHFEQMVVRYGPQNKTTYFLMGGNFRMKRFTPGAHANKSNKPQVRLCAVNCIGGEYPEFYLSGYYHPDIVPTASAQGNPHCYINGGKFGLMAGAGYDKIAGDVTFKIDHSIIREFYGGGINAARPIGGSIDVTINNSLVYDIFCGGPKVGPMTSGKTVTTNAKNTIFNRFFGGGNGGNSYYRKNHTDGDKGWPSEDANGWNGYGYSAFNPLGRYVTDKDEGDLGYDAIFEFEVFNSSNGTDANCVIRTYYNYLEFGTTTTGSITNTLTDCTVKDNFFGGGNMGNVTGNVESTLTNTQVLKSAFGGGQSASIPTFHVHDKSKTHFPHRDKTGTITNGGYIEDNPTEYTWIHEIPTEWGISPAPSTSKPTFTYGGKNYVYTQKDLSDLGSVSGYTSLTLKGTSAVTGNVYGGGDESKVNGNTTVNIQGNTHVNGDVFGGGNKAEVGGSAKVNIKNE